MSNYSHDAQVVTYSGPDADYQGRELLIGSNEDEVILVDITDKENPELISTTGYSNVGYTHQGWFTNDQRYFLLGDEFDELSVGFNTRTVIFDFTDLDNPFPLFEYFGTTAAVDHNGYVLGDRYYLANYEAGLRVMDISQIGNLEMEEIAHFDTYPASNNPTFNGTWNVYPFFESRTVLITGEAGMTLVRDPDELLTNQPEVKAEITLYPNPADEIVFLRSDTEPLQQVEIMNTLGQIIRNFTLDNTRTEKIAISSLNAGLYLIRVNNDRIFRLVVN
nr:choice-of-anchor B family protein [Aureitalea marina]